MRQMEQGVLRVHGAALVYDVRSDCKVWLRQADPSSGWCVVAHLEGQPVEMQTAGCYPDLFAAIHEAWRVAVAVRDVTDPKRFTEVLTVLFGMIPAKAVHLSKDLLQLVRAAE